MNFDAGVLAILVKTTVILIGANALALTLRRASASARHAVWAVSLCAVLLLPVASILLPAVNLPILGEAKTATDAAVAAPVSEGTAVPSLAGLPATKQRVEVRRPEGHQARAWNWRLGLALVWGLGSLMLLLGWYSAMRDLRRLKRNSSPCVDGRWPQLLTELKSEFSISRFVELRIGSEPIPPMTWGIVRHVVLLPASALEWTLDRCRMVLAHELAHVKRHDGVIRILTQAACSVYWFNPLVWHAVHCLQIERERACDDRVLRLGAQAADCADYLLEIARALNSRYGSAAISMSQPSQLKSRMIAILEPGAHRHTLPRRALALLLALSGLLTVSMGVIHLTAQSPGTLPTVASSDTGIAIGVREAAKLPLPPPPGAACTLGLAGITEHISRSGLNPKSIEELLDHSSLIVDAYVQEVFPLKGMIPREAAVLLVADMLKGSGVMNQFAVTHIFAQDMFKFEPGQRFILFLNDGFDSYSGSDRPVHAGIPRYQLAAWEPSALFCVDGEKIRLGSRKDWRSRFDGRSAAEVISEIRSYVRLPKVARQTPVDASGALPVLESTATPVQMPKRFEIYYEWGVGDPATILVTPGHHDSFDSEKKERLFDAEGGQIKYRAELTDKETTMIYEAIAPIRFLATGRNFPGRISQPYMAGRLRLNMDGRIMEFHFSDDSAHYRLDPVWIHLQTVVRRLEAILRAKDQKETLPPHKGYWFETGGLKLPPQL